MVVVKNQAVNKKNQRKLKKEKKVIQVKQEENNEGEDDCDFESDKPEDKEYDLDLKEGNKRDDSDESFLKEKLFILKKKANKFNIKKNEKKDKTKLNKAKKGEKEENMLNNENKALTKLTKDNVKSNIKTNKNTKESQKEKDARSLYIRKLPDGVTKQDLKNLSKDIVGIYLQTKKYGPHSRFAYIRFDDEATAETNYSVLQSMKIKDQPLNVDYVGSKSSYNNANLRKERNARKLYVGDLPHDITEMELKMLSEDIVEIFISYGKKRFAFLIFDSEDKAKSNYEVLKDKKIRGQPIVVNLNLSRDSITKTDKRGQDDDIHAGQKSAKKVRR